MITIRKKLLLICVICFLAVLFLGIFIYKNITDKIYINNYESYLSLINNINSSFTYSDYNEIMKEEQNHVLALPLNYKSINQNDNFYGRQKLFVYKHKTKSTLIMLQITFNNSKENLWSTSYDYSPKIFNEADSKYGEFYNNNIPDIQVATNSFSYQGCFYDTLSFSEDGGSEIAATELMSFSNALINFISNNSQ